MATPTSLTEALEILNLAKNNEGFQADPEITAENLETIGVLPPNVLNKYINGINLIIEQRYFTSMFDSSKNPWRKFFIDLGKVGFGIKDMFVEMVEGQTPMWDASYTDQQVVEDLVKYAVDKVKVKYHEQNMEKQFKATIDEREYSKMFTAAGLPRFIDAKIINLASSAELWLQNEVIGLNKEGVMTCADSGDLFLITTHEIMERINVQDLSAAFNVNFANIPANVVYAPNGTNLGTDAITHKKALFILIDRKALVLGIRTWRMTNFPIPNTLKHNNWLSIEGLKSYNTFFTAVAFCGDYDTFKGETPVIVKNTTTEPVNTKEVTSV